MRRRGAIWHRSIPHHEVGHGFRPLSNSATDGYGAKVIMSEDAYATRVAAPVMRAVDEMPEAYRALVNEYGYVDVYRAWRRGMSPHLIIDRAHDGLFRL